MGPSLSIQFQKVQFTLFGMVSPIFEFHAGILLLYIVAAMPIHQFCSTISATHLLIMPKFTEFTRIRV